MNSDTAVSEKLAANLEEMINLSAFWPPDGSGELIRADFENLKPKVLHYSAKQAECAALAIAGIIDSMKSAPNLYVAGDTTETISAVEHLVPSAKARFGKPTEAILRKWAKTRGSSALTMRILWYLSFLCVAAEGV